MKKGGLFFLLLTISVLLLHISSAEDSQQNSSITGKVTSQPFNLAVQVIASYPSIDIVSPKNNTYWQNQTFLNYSASDAAHIWYSIDNGANISITSARFFNTSSGFHILWLYANSTPGYVTAKNINFTVDFSKPYINYTNYSNSGASTDFAKYSFEELQSLQRVTFEKTSAATIRFTEAINVTDTNIIQNNVIDLNKEIFLAYNYIYINSTAIPNFNKAATLSLYSLPFTNPVIMKDGVECPQIECIVQSYTSGNLVFNVNHFSTYSAEEGAATSGGDSSSSSSSSSGGGGGGGGATNDWKSNKKVEIISDKLILSMKQGETRSSQFTITNNEKSEVRVDFELTENEEFILLPYTSTYLLPGETKTIPFDVVVRENTAPEVYIKQIVVKTDNKEIGRANLVVDVSSRKSLFDVKINLIDSKINVNQPLVAEVELYNFGETGRIDTAIDYVIKNINNEEVYKEHDTAAIETQLNLVKVININNLEEGSYILYVKSTYDNNIASASQWFEIAKERNISLDIVILSLLGALLALGIYYSFFKKRLIDSESWYQRFEETISKAILQKKVYKAVEKIDGTTTKKPVVVDHGKIYRLQQQLKQLEYVHSKGLVDDKEYQVTKSEIESKINALK